MISIIVAIAENNAIGKNNELLWHISEDLKRFKKITTGKTIIMGKNTFLSLPNGALPNRRNIVISDCSTDVFTGAETVFSIEDVMSIINMEEENLIIGGGMIYKLFLPFADKIYLTKVYDVFDADVFFPTINYNEWNIIDIEEHLENDPKYDFLTMIRKKKNIHSSDHYNLIMNVAKNYIGRIDGDDISEIVKYIDDFSFDNNYNVYSNLLDELYDITNIMWCEYGLDYGKTQSWDDAILEILEKFKYGYERNIINLITLLKIIEKNIK
jgi:dihydrofolate reductase